MTTIFPQEQTCAVPPWLGGLWTSKCSAVRTVATARGTYELTRRYLCASLILSVEGSDAQAGRAALMGAWAADDAAGRQGTEDGGSTERPADDEAVEAAREAAARCRRLAIAYFEADRKRGLTFADDEATAGALLADLQRRVGDFAAARACARAGMVCGPEGLLLEVLRAP